MFHHCLLRSLASTTMQINEQKKGRLRRRGGVGNIRSRGIATRALSPTIRGVVNGGRALVVWIVAVGGLFHDNKMSNDFVKQGPDVAENVYDKSQLSQEKTSVGMSHEEGRNKGIARKERDRWINELRQRFKVRNGVGMAE